MYSGKLRTRIIIEKKFIWNFRNICTRICIYQKLFVSLQAKIVSYRMKNIPIKRFLSWMSGVYELDNQHFTPPIRFVSM